jgi:hypothetical protein
VAESFEERAPAAPAGHLARRQFLLKAAVAGTAVWAVPSIVAMRPAVAAGLNSRPPPPPKPVSRHVDPIHAQPAPADTQLPFTGDDNADLVVAGVAATAAGASLLFLSKAGDRLGLEAALTDDA